MGDAVTCVVRGQTTPGGHCTLDQMPTGFGCHGDQIACCGTCPDARGLAAEHLVEDAARSTMDELAGRTVESDQVLTF